MGERIARRIEAERLVDNTCTSDDEAYNDAIDTAARIAREVGVESDPLQRFAEWVASLKTYPDAGYIGHSNGVPVTAAVLTAGARKALGKE